MSAAKIEFLDSGRSPTCEPDPKYPNGMDVHEDRSAKGKTCKFDLPYPAPRCGAFVVECGACKKRVAITAAGRQDDPRSLTVVCWPREKEAAQ